MPAAKRVWIGAFADDVQRYRDAAIVCVDVFSFATSAVTAVATGRRTLAASTTSRATRRAASLAHPVLTAEGRAPFAPGFEPDLGPAGLERRTDVERPLVLVSPTAQMLENARGGQAVFVACLRNVKATVEALAKRHSRVAVLPAGEDGEMRCEDQLAAVRIARALVDRGFEPEDRATVREIERWGRADLPVVKLGKGAEELRRGGREDEVRFVLDHVDDLDTACVYVDGEIESLADVRERLAG